MKTEILNSKGEPVILNDKEKFRAAVLQQKYDSEFRNALGFDVNITTLTAISKSIVEQKFFTLAPADYVPLRVGENAWSDQILTYLDYQISGDFETGIINTGSSDSRLAEADAGVTPVYNPVVNWAKQISWTFFDLQLASKSGNWDLVTSKERARKRNWDLGVQKIAFFGSNSNSKVMGLLTQAGITANTSLITGNISAMNAANFSAFVSGLMQAYRANAQQTTYPTHFIIPEADYNGLCNLIPGTAGTYPMPMLNYLLEAFKLITRNQNFKILPCAYADVANNATISGLNKNRYTLLNYDEDSLRMDIPVDYTNTMQNTINGFQFQNAGYGQFTGVLAYRPLEMLYFDHA